MLAKRIANTQDIVKGLLITSVVFFHALMFMVLPNTGSVLTDFNILFALFPFLLMVFFFYAGYNYTPGKRTPVQNIKNRSVQLLIPLASVFVLNTVLVFAIRLPTGESLEALWNGIIYFFMSQPLAQMIGFPANGVLNFDLVLGLGILWFLYALYFVSIFFYLIVDYAIQKPSRLISIISILLIAGFCLGQFVGTYLPYTCQCYPVVLAIMLLAAYLKQSRFLDKPVEKKKDLVLLIVNTLVAELIIVGIELFGYFAFGATMVGSLPGGLYNSILKGFDAFLAFIVGFLGTYVIHTVSRGIGKIPVVSIVLDWYGRHSSFVYLLHPICLTFTHYVIFQQQIVLGDFQPFLYVFITIGFFVVAFLIMDLIRNKINASKQTKVDAGDVSDTKAD